LGGTIIGEDVKLKEEKTKVVPIWEKVTLTVAEAAEYSGIGRNKIRELTDKPFCTFVLYNGTKRMIKRKEFEKYLTVQKAI
jgi:excisionase family DNA binding protein